MRLQLLLCIVVFVLASLLPAHGQRPGKRCLGVTACARGGGARGAPGRGSCLAAGTPGCFSNRIRQAVFRPPGRVGGWLAAAATRSAGPGCALPRGVQRRWEAVRQEPREPGSFAGGGGQD